MSSTNFTENQLNIREVSITFALFNDHIQNFATQATCSSIACEASLCCLQVERLVLLLLRRPSYGMMICLLCSVIHDGFSRQPD